ncbi:MAG: CatA-like O-acetyltransferase [Lachnospiraceae bacterium]
MEDPIYLDMKQYKRLKHFQYFCSLEMPYVGTTVETKITEFYHWTKQKNYPFFLSFLWCVSQAANTIPEFRQRIEGDELTGYQITEYPFCRTSHTVAKEDDTYSYCILDAREAFTDYLKSAATLQEQARQFGDIEEDETEARSMIFISTLPWLTYTSLIQPTPIPADSNPRITWGKFFIRDESIYMPVTVLCHHALVDGKHIAAFYSGLESVMKELTYK